MTGRGGVGWRRAGGGFWCLAVLLCVACVTGLALGSAPIGPGDVWKALTGSGDDPTHAAIVRSLRAPRVAAGALVGAALGLSGTLFQALLRNPLAEPYLLGVSSGAAFGAVAALTLGLGFSGPVGAALAALLGALIAIVIVFRVAQSSGRLDTRAMILAGVVVSSFFAAGVMVLLTVARDSALRSAISWTMGSLGGSTWMTVWVLAVVTVPLATGALMGARHLNALALGEQTAAHLGTRVEGSKRAAFFAASALAATTVSTAGVIGFIGLVAPHTARMLWGADHRHLVPLAMLAGAAALVLADTLARTVVRPIELPVGVITAVLGVPFFLVLLRRSHV